MVGGSVEDLSVGRWLMVGGSVEDLSVVGCRCSVTCRIAY